MDIPLGKWEHSQAILWLSQQMSRDGADDPINILALGASGL